MNSADRPTARLGYAVEELGAFLQAGEHRIAELEAAITAAECRRDDALRRSAEATALRRRIATEWLEAWEDAQLTLHPTLEDPR